jgi:hypothetical protein
LPPCFFSDVKHIEVTSYVGDFDELFVLKMVLEHVALDELVITIKRDGAEKLQMQETLYRQLTEFPKVLQNCKIVLK